MFKSIINDSSNPIYYQNRALCFYRLGKYEETEQDAKRAIELDSESMKGHYYLGLALTNLERLNSAENHLQKAYNLAIKDPKLNGSAVHICEALLQCRKAKWEHDERQRIRRSNGMYEEISEFFDKKYETQKQAFTDSFQRGEIDRETYNDEIDFLEREQKEKTRDLWKIFEQDIAKDGKSLADRIPPPPPDYLVDPISFNLFVDPVTTKSGRSYERSWLRQHMKTSQTDPFSRERITEADIYPNINLKNAAEDYMKNYGSI